MLELVEGHVAEVMPLLTGGCDCVDFCKNKHKTRQGEQHVKDFEEMKVQLLTDCVGFRFSASPRGELIYLPECCVCVVEDRRDSGKRISLLHLT